MQKILRIGLLICFLPFTSQLFADEKANLDKVKKKIEANIPTITIDSISESRMPGVYEIMSSGQILYVSEDAKYLLSGKLFSIENGIKDLTEESKARFDMKVAPTRRAKLDVIPASEMIVFKAADEKHRVTVFTDVDCAYCRKLHKEMPNYNKLGITVQYMGFPRAGLGSPSHKKLQTVWCAKDQQMAMNNAKNKREFGTDTCNDPLAGHFQLVREFGLTGTPAIILKSGRVLPGYVNAENLLSVIKEDEELLAQTVAKN